MKVTYADLLRFMSMRLTFDIPTFKNCWTVWKKEVRDVLGDQYDENSLLNIGDSLSDIFKSTGGKGRGQSSLSGGGVGWEALICWYLNLCSYGSNVVVLKRMKLVPKPLQDAITVNYGNFSCNTESDLTVIVFPKDDKYSLDISSLEDLTPKQINKLTNQLNHLVESDFHMFSVGVIQCKTNWNDNSQIPMLWDMIYSGKGFRDRNITLGKNNFSIESLKKFTYSFVTVPSNKRTKYKPNTVAVKRVNNLSGGNYWGKITEDLVAKSIKEIFSINFSEGFTYGIRNTLKTNIEKDKELFERIFNI